MKIRPINRYVVCKLHEEPKKQTLIITSAEEPKNLYDVLWTTEDETLIKPGDVIMCNRYEVLENEIEGEKIYLVKSDKIIGVKE